MKQSNQYDGTRPKKERKNKKKKKKKMIKRRRRRRRRRRRGKKKKCYCLLPQYGVESIALISSAYCL